VGTFPMFTQPHRPRRNGLPSGYKSYCQAPLFHGKMPTMVPEVNSGLAQRGMRKIAFPRRAFEDERFTTSALPRAHYGGENK
jgi:hypothetical protein